MIDQLLRSIPTDQIAEAIGEDPQATRQAVKASLPALLGGLTANAERADGAQSLLAALGRHQDGLAEGASVDQIDVQDGEKIVGHVFGGNTDAVVNQLGGMSGPQTSSLVRKLLPILAPIVLSWLAKQVVGGGGGGSAAATGRQAPGQPDGPLGQGRPEASPEQGSTDLTSVLQDVLGSALGSATGTRSSGSSGSSGGILSDVLGSILGRR
ncbi:Glycine-rich cell wall structural protein precursor [Serinicoccus hydrothermalis]|uniref:Glycine-rich cell wall structural protein n=1 Tax=Serinicoccus hydrothermalis TaxID=1758689 RepID=A0A1B1NA24_9MICO|nr:DUF937 domain-containing protein [Serinicoccus hydrothermalis]ANS78235.1 Glycine-rich cell wall structural protein precursor [Serinicoccus hydrothermalis]